MKRSEKGQLVAIIIVALIIVLVAWYAITRPRYYEATTLTEITYVPASVDEDGPYLTFGFAGALPTERVAGTSAILVGFEVAASSPTPASIGAGLVAALAKGLPFVPTLGGPTLGGPSLGGPSLGGPSLGGPSLGGPSLAGGAATVTTNTVPRDAPAAPMRLTGVGIMRFIVPTH
ncbi:MAG: hypothetical protein WC052_04540 [Patescibacteria group bacterium]